MHDAIRGLWVAVATPLDPAGAVDHAVLVRHCQTLLAQGCDGLVLFATAGEGPSFAASERLVAAEALLQAGIPAACVAIGTGCPAVPDTVALTRGALAIGLTHALILPPYFFRDAPEQGVEDALASIIDGVASGRLRATLCHAPAAGGVPVSAACLGRLHRRFGGLIAGIEDTTGDPASLMAFRAAAPACAVLTGAEVEIRRADALGAAGAVSALANIVPALVRASLHDAAAEASLRALSARLAGPGFIPLLKSVLASRSGDGAWRAVRPPLRPADAAAGARVAASLEARRAA